METVSYLRVLRPACDKGFADHGAFAVINPLDIIRGISLEDLNAQLRSGNLHPAEVEKAIKYQKQAFGKGVRLFMNAVVALMLTP